MKNCDFWKKIRREKEERAVGNGYWETMFPEFNSPYSLPRGMASRIKGIEFHWIPQIGELKCFLASVCKWRVLRCYVLCSVSQLTILGIETNGRAIPLWTELSAGPACYLIRRWFRISWRVCYQLRLQMKQYRTHNIRTHGLPTTH